MYSLVFIFLPGAVSDEIAYRRQAPELAAADTPANCRGGRTGSKCHMTTRIPQPHTMRVVYVRMECMARKLLRGDDPTT